MYICICNGVTDQQVREAAAAGCTSVTELRMRTGLGANCGSCLSTADAILHEVRTRRDLPLPLLQHAA